VRFLTRHFEGNKVAKAVDEYRLGATRNGSVIFWQIDVKGKVRTGKIMQYDTGSCRARERANRQWCELGAYEAGEEAVWRSMAILS
jgi:hypothetical protein